MRRRKEEEREGGREGKAGLPALRPRYILLSVLTVYVLVWCTLCKRSEKGEKSVLFEVIRRRFLAYAGPTMPMTV